MAKNKNIILIIVAVIIVLGLGVYGVFYYSGLRNKVASNPNLLSITSREIKGNYVPAAISDIFSLPASGVTSTVETLSNQRQQYISAITSSNPSATFDQLKSQLVKNGYFIYGQSDKNYSLSASKAGEIVQVMAISNSSSSFSFIISVYK